MKYLLTFAFALATLVSTATTNEFEVLTVREDGIPPCFSNMLGTVSQVAQLQAQITREFLHFDIYLGGENLTNYKMPNPILYASEPWSNAFDATQVWGPTDGIKLYLGLRFKIEKY